MSRKSRPEAPTKRTGPSSLSDDAMTADELAARIQVKYDAWLAAWRENPRPPLDWAADKPTPGQRFVDSYPERLHLFTADDTLRSAA